MSHLKILQPDFANRPGQDATAAHTTNTTTTRPEAMKRRGEKRLVKAQQTYHMRADCKTLPTEILQPYNILLLAPRILCSALFLYAFATLLGLSDGRLCMWVGWIQQQHTLHFRAVGRSENLRVHVVINLKPFKRERICFYSCQNRGRGSDCPHAPTVPTVLYWRLFWLFVNVS